MNFEKTNTDKNIRQSKNSNNNNKEVEKKKRSLEYEHKSSHHAAPGRVVEALHQRHTRAFSTSALANERHPLTRLDGHRQTPQYDGVRSRRVRELNVVQGHLTATFSLRKYNSQHFSLMP